MISVLFIGIAVMFLFLAMASYVLKLRIEEPHSKVIAVVRREIANENKGARGWASLDTLLYKTVNHHFRFEVAGFLIAAFAAILEFFLATRW